MDILIAQIQADLRSSDALRQSGALLQALQQSAAGRDVSAVSKSTVDEILASPSSAVCKKLAIDLLRSISRLPPELWDAALASLRSDLDFPDPDVSAAILPLLSVSPSHHLPLLLSSTDKLISRCFDSPSPSLRLAVTDTLSHVLSRPDLLSLCESSPSVLDRSTHWWARISSNLLDRSDPVSSSSFLALSRLFRLFHPSSRWLLSAVDFVWRNRSAVISRSLVLPVESFRATVFPLVYAAKAVASRPPSGPADGAEKAVGVSDVVSHLLPFLSSLDPPLIFEVGINMLSLADVPGGKPEWASAAIIAILTLWDRQEFSPARESIVRAVVTNLHLLDLHMQVSLFKRLLLMVRNLRAESDRMHALACICRTALCVDLFAKESVRRGQKPLAGTDIASLFEDVRTKDDLNSITSKSLFREELVASLVESCFQLSLPLPEQKTMSGTETRVIGALAYGTGYGALNWTESALEVVEVCKPCVIWDCDGRTYAIDCYLKLLVRLCHIYDTRGGVKTIKTGASQDQILNETRLRNLQLQLIRDLREVHTPRISARLIWAIAEHFDLEGLDPLLADDPEDPLNIIISNIHKVLFNTDTSATSSNKLQDVQAVLLCAQRVGSRNARAGQLLTKELEDFRSSNLADSVNKHQCRYILQSIKYITAHPEYSPLSTMAVGVSLQLPHELGIHKKYGRINQFQVYKIVAVSISLIDISVCVRMELTAIRFIQNSQMKSWRHRPSLSLSSCSMRQDAWSLHVTDKIYKTLNYDSFRYNLFMCRSFVIPSSAHGITIWKNTSLSLTRIPLALQLAPAVGIIAFAVWGLGPLMRYSRNMFPHRNDNNWKKSRTHYVFTSYLQPMLLWAGATLICRAVDPVVLPSEASQAVKQRFLNFIRSSSTVLAFAYCLSSFIQQSQKFFMESNGSDDARKMGYQFAGKALYTAVWVAAVSLFMELLGFSTQKWLTAGGLGTVLLTLAGREIFTNFLSSIMIHATRPFVQNEWIQTKIEDYDVSGTVEHVGWWSPTIIRGEDREAVHIPNHKFTVNVVRNLSQKTHWRIKTHLAISHLDVNKINNIVADMRKVLAKNPQIEQQRLHRRVFLENINPENQALLILVSCFVKTSHFEEYLCVKEAILLDLLRVISHHRARLATPIRTVQKIYSDADTENIPFSDTVFTRAGTTINRPLLLVEPLSRINGDDKSKHRSAPQPNDDQVNKTTAASHPKPTQAAEGTIQSNMDKQQNKKANTGDVRPKSSKLDTSTVPSSDSSPKPQVDGDDKSPITEAPSERADVLTPTTANNDSEKLPSSSTPSVARPVFEDNIVLGMALEGSKRTLPIEEGIGLGSVPSESDEVAVGRSSPSSNPKDRKGQIPAVPGAATKDQREHER